MNSTSKHQDKDLVDSEAQENKMEQEFTETENILSDLIDKLYTLRAEKSRIESEI